MWHKRSWRRFWAVGNGVSVLALVVVDWMIRKEGNSFMAPSRDLLWLSVALGASIGAIELAAAWLMSHAQREFVTEFTRAPLRERRRWRYQRRNLRYGVRTLLLLCGLAGWCWFNGVFFLPAIYAVNTVYYAALPPWLTAAPPEPDAAPDRG